MNDRPTWVVMPARDELDHLPACLAALRVSSVRAPGPVRVIVVDDGSTDGTGDVARATFATWTDAAPAVEGVASSQSPSGVVLLGPSQGVGWARRVGIEHALAELGERRTAPGRWNAGAPPSVLVATTDADSTVEPAWLGAMHARLDEGHHVIAGDVALGANTDPMLVAARDKRLEARLATLPEGERGSAPHPHFAGSNLAFSAEALAALGPLPTPRSLEDDAVLQRCRAIGLAVLRDHRPVVVTSARMDGRASGGLADALRADAHRLIAGRPSSVEPDPNATVVSLPMSRNPRDVSSTVRGTPH